MGSKNKPFGNRPPKEWAQAGVGNHACCAIRGLHDVIAWMGKGFSELVQRESTNYKLSDHDKVCLSEDEIGKACRAVARDEMLAAMGILCALGFMQPDGDKNYSMTAAKLEQLRQMLSKPPEK